MSIYINGDKNIVGNNNSQKFVNEPNTNDSKINWGKIAVFVAIIGIFVAAIIAIIAGWKPICDFFK